MSTLKQMKTNFVSGEIDPYMLARADIKAYHNAARRMRNVVAMPQGGFTTRPGSVYMADYDQSVVRMASFQYTTDEAYLFVFTPLQVRIFYNRALVATLATPYTATDLVAQFRDTGDMISSGINWTQTLDQLVVYHENHAPRLIKRGSSHTDWTISIAVFTNVPRVEFPGGVYTNGVNEIQEFRFPHNPDGGAGWSDGDTFSLIIEDEETDPILMPQPNGAGTSATLATRMQTAINALPNVGGGVTVVSYTPSASVIDTGFEVSFTGVSGNRPWGAATYKILSSQQTPGVSVIMVRKGERPGEDAISDVRGWPRHGVFFQGRHWMVGSKQLPNTILATRAATDWDLNNKKTSDDYGFLYSADTDDVPIFLNIYPGRHLQIFSTSGEFYVPVSDREGVTPTNMALRRTTSRGMKPGTRVCEVDGATVFIQSGGQALREFIYADTEAAYQANSISILASHLMLNPLSLTLRKASSTDDADLMFMPNPDGSMTVFCTLRTQEVNAYTLWLTDGAYKEVCPVYNTIYVAVWRTVNGQNRLFIEALDDDLPVDCGLSAGASTSATLAWLPNTEVSIVLDDAVQERQTTNGAGLVTFDRPAVDSAMVGLPWPEVAPGEYPEYRWLVETLPVDADLQDGTMFGRKRRIVWAAVRIHNTNGLMINNSRIAMRHFGGFLLDRPNPRVTGIKKLTGFLGYDYEGKVVFGETAPTQSTVLALSWAVSV